MVRDSVNIRPMKRTDQDRCQNLIYCGLRDNFGTHFSSAIRHPDLEDIAEWYRNETFIVAEIGGLVVGTGALIQEDPITGRIVRMSVAREHRRKGIGRRVLDELKKKQRFVASKDSSSKRQAVEIRDQFLQNEQFSGHRA